MLVIAHRGASGHRPENTLSAIEYALTLGATAVELDVHFVEGELYVFHDRRLEFKSTGVGVIDRQTQQQFTFDEMYVQLDGGGTECERVFNGTKGVFGAVTTGATVCDNQH